MEFDSHQISVPLIHWEGVLLLGNPVSNLCIMFSLRQKCSLSLNFGNTVEFLMSIAILNFKFRFSSLFCHIAGKSIMNNISEFLSIHYGAALGLMGLSIADVT